MKKIYEKIVLCVLSFMIMFPITNIKAANYIPRLSAPSTSDYHYYSDNPFYNAGYGMPNCTAYAWGRAYEILGYKPRLSTGNANKWWSYNISVQAFNYGTLPKVGSIMCWNGDYGHVAVVEKVSGNSITISESSYGGFNFRTKTDTITNTQNYNSGFQGYIYLGDFDTELKPSKPTLSVSPGNSITNTQLSWNATSNTHHYDLRIYNSAGTLVLGKTNLTSQSFSYALPAGNYYANVASVGSDTNNYTFSDNVSFTVKVQPGKPTLKVTPGTNTYKTTFNWNKTSDTDYYALRIYQKSSTEEYKLISNITSLSYSVVLPSGDYYAKVNSSNSSNKAYTFSDNVYFTVSKDPTKSSDGWYYTDQLPPYVNSSQYTIEYYNTTEKVASKSPGTGYVKGSLVKSQYENSGSSYWSNIELPTSNTRVLVSYHYYHCCSGSTGVYANYELNNTYVHEDRIYNTSAVYIDSSGPDSDNPNYKYYKLRWNDGSLAYCSSGTTCDGSCGTHGNRSYIWYRNSQYQDKVKVDYYKYTKTSGWVSTKDSSATSVKYRYKLKVTSYTPTIKDYNGTYDGKAHTISMSGIKSGSTIKYRTSSTGTWSTTKPTRTSAGTTTVYYQITHPDYNTISGSKKIIINKRSVTGLSYSSISHRTYTGKQIKPSLTVKYGSKTLKNGTDYSLSYGANKYTGKATIKVTGKGNYTGSVTRTFYIVPKAPTSLRVTAAKKSARVSYKKSTGASGYEIAYSTSQTKGFKTVSLTGASKTITKLTSKKTYYFKVRAYKTVSGKKYYGPYTSLKSVKVK